ncbi:Na+/H+ antiporter subunit E [Rhodoferax sp.]|uniref:Na+/H+ antiporter subunit E n=1 Tax=Rhodoferax sp. TaxID=50421 RepID=UPI0039B82087
MLLARAALLATLWWTLADGTAWAFGAPVVLLAAGASVALQPTRCVRLRPLALARFAGFFALRSVRAGLDVARRALSPRLPLAPTLLDYSLRLTSEPARVFLANTLSLLPGTLSADLTGDRLRVHVLDASLPIEQELRAAEVRIAALFGQSLPDLLASSNGPKV